MRLTLPTFLFPSPCGGGKLWFALLFALLLAGPARAESFAEFLRAFEAKAMAGGVSETVYELSTKGLTPDSTIPDLVTTQPEFTTPIWGYLDQRVTEKRITAGMKAMAANQSLFAVMGERFGVDPYVLGAIWGIETNYGSVLSSSKLIKPIV